MEPQNKSARENQPAPMEVNSRKQASSCVWQSQEDLATLIDNLADAIFKSRDGIIVWCNDRVEDVLGHPKEDLLGTDGSVLFPHVTDYAQHRDSAHKLTEESGHYRGTAEVTKKDGRPAFLEFSISRISGKEPPEYVVVAGDITRRVLAQRALQQANDELEQRVAERTSELERANDEVQRSEERFRALIENSTDGITILDSDGLLKYESPSVARITGYDPGERSGEKSFDLVYPDDMPDVLEGLRRLQQNPGGTEHLEVRVLHRNGTWRTLEVVARNLLDDPAVAGIVVNQRDITERKEAEEELVSLHTALNASPEGVVIVGSDGNVMDVNESVLKGYGYSSKADMVGKAALDFIAPEDRDKVSSFVERMATDGYVENFEHRIITRDGKLIPVEANAITLKDKDGGARGYVIVVRDASARKQAEEELRRSEERFRALIENSTDGVTLLDAEGMLKYESPSVPRMTGYEPGEWFGRSTFEAVHPDDVERVTDSFSRLWRSPGGTERLQMRFRHKDGTWRTIEVVATNLLDDPAVEGVVVNKRDITERTQAEEALQRSEAHYRLLAENLTDVIWTMDLDLRYTYTSPSVTRLRGFTVEEVMAQSVADTLPPSSLEKATAALAEELALEKEGNADPHRSRILEVEMYRKNMPTIWAELKMTFLRDRDGKPVGILGVTRDITQRMEAEEAVREAERRYRAIFDNRLQMVYVMNEQGVFLDANDCALERLGYTRDDLATVSLKDIVHPDDLTSAIESTMEIWATGFQERPQEHRLITRSGELMHVVSSSVPLVRSDDRYVGLGIALDVTEARRSEVQLRESEEKLKRYLDSSPDGIYISDSTATFLYGNRAAERIVGYSREELIGKSFLELDLLPEEHLPKAARLVEMNVAGEPTGPDEFELVRKDGSRVPVEISTYPIGEGDSLEVIGIARDITERKRMERALRESEESLRTLIENAPEAITAYDLAGIIIDCNRKGEEMLGYPREELVGRSIFELGLIPQDYVARASSALEKGNWDRSGRPFEFDLLRKDGSRITVEATTILVERGGRSEIICISRDVTGRKHMEQQLQLAGRLAAVGELAAGVAHELNNPLAAVQGFAQFLAERDSLDETTRGDLETIYKEAQRATRITGNLLSFARKHAPEKVSVSMNDVVEHSLELHAYRMKVNNVEVVTELAPDLPKTMVDFHQMQQVFVNLITNAEQAMTEEHGKGRLLVRTEQVGRMIRVSLADSGPGMPDDVMKSAFDPFFTTKDVGKGTGLGLSICYGIVREHGGRLYAESEPGMGATLVAEIPIVSDDAENQAEAGAADRSQPDA